VCQKSIIVFDQVESIPAEVIDAILPFTIYPAHKRAIFVFISNVGSSDISNIALEAWKAGRNRESLQYKEFEGPIKLAVQRSENEKCISKISTTWVLLL